MMRMKYVVPALLAVLAHAGGVGAQALVSPEAIDLDIEACLAPGTIDEWREAGMRAGVRPMEIGDSLCSVLTSRGVFVSVVVNKDGPPGVEPFGLCYPADDGTAEVHCAMFRRDDGEWRIRRLQRLPS